MCNGEKLLESRLPAPQRVICGKTIREEKMFLTETEAEKKYCPMPNCHTCTGSRCMAWRWLEIPNQIVIEGNAGMERPVGIPDNWRWEEDIAAKNKSNPVCGWVEPLQDVTKRRKGYCGIAGQPANFENKIFRYDCR